MVLLGEIHELEVVRERARDALGHGRVEPGDQLGELVPGSGSPSAVVLAALLWQRRIASSRSKSSPSCSTSVLAENASEVRDVAPQRAEGIGLHRPAVSSAPISDRSSSR